MTTAPNWFIGLPVPVEQLPDGLLASLPPGVRRIHPRDLHITLAFLGRVGEPRARRAWAALMPHQETLVTHTAARSAFGPRKRPSAIGLDLEGAPGDGELTAFIACWRDVLREAAGVAAETRPVRPHLTLGRPPRRAGGAIAARIRRWLEEPGPQLALELDAVALYRRAAETAERDFEIVETASPL